MTDVFVLINVDKKSYTEKPTDRKEIGGIQNRMTKPQEISFRDFVAAVCDGRSFRQCAAVGKGEKDFISSQIIAVDIDNDPGKNRGILSPDEAISRAKNNRLTINFMYPSFRDSPEQRKFRMIFLLDKPITRLDDFRKAYDYIQGIFPELDPACRNCAHFFFGTQAEPILVKYERLNSRKSILNRGNRVRRQAKAAMESASEKRTQTPTEPKGDNIKAIREHNAEYLKRKLHKKKTVFDNRQDFFHWLYKELDMAELLEIDNPKSFNCIFHDDSNPSATIFKTAYGTWKYKCFSSNCEVDTLNVKELVEKLGDFRSEYQSIEFIKTIYNVSIKKTTQAEEQENNLLAISDCFNSSSDDGFVNCCPNAYKTTRNAAEIYNAILRIARKAIYPDCAESGNVIFYMSIRQLARESGKSSIDKVSKYLKLLIYHEMIEIVPDDKVPRNQLLKALKYRQEGQSHIQFYSIPSWVLQQKQRIDHQGIEWKDHKYRINGISYECFYRSEGEETAKRLYPQTSSYTDKDGETHTKTPSLKSDQRSAAIANFILASIEHKGYTTEKEVIDGLKGKMGATMTELQIKRSITEIMDTYGLKKDRATTELKAKYGINGSQYSHPVIIVFDTTNE